MKIFTFIFTTVFFISILLLVLFFIFYGILERLTDYRQLSKYEPSVVSRVHAGNGALLKEYSTERRVFVPIDVIPKKIISAFLSAEDKDFYEHIGVDLQAITRALITNLKTMERKKISWCIYNNSASSKKLLLSSEVTFERKIKEAILAIRIERAFSKKEILELYLNEIYLGNNSYGIAAAALNYFDKSLDDLTIDEAAFLATLPKAPSKYNPKTNYERVLDRRNWVLNQMYKNGYLTVTKKINYKREIVLTKSSGLDDTSAPYFAEEVRRKMLNEFGFDALYEGGLSIRTTLNPELQKYADEALFNGLENLDKRQGWRGPLDYVNYEKVSNNELNKILNKHQVGLPQNRIGSIVKKIKNNNIFLHTLDGK